MKTIIAPTDFSPISLNAVDYAADMACSINADLSLLHICLLPMTYGGEVPYPMIDIEGVIQSAEMMIQQAKNDLDKKTAGKINVYTEVKAAATVLGALVDYCAEKKPYAVVVGTQGSSAIEGVFFGSTTISAMRHLNWPLILVPPQAKFTTIKKIGLACDLKKVDETIPFSEIRELIKQFNAKLYVLHINTEGEKGYTSETMIESRSLQEMLDDLHPVYRFLSYNDVENGLEEFAEKNQLDILVIVPKKHNIIDKLFHRSHSKKMVLHTHVPLMSIHE